jgi:hypothetical protein
MSGKRRKMQAADGNLQSDRRLHVRQPHKREKELVCFNMGVSGLALP